MSTTKTYLFVLGMTLLVALLLAGTKIATQGPAAVNEDIFNKRQILNAIAVPLSETGKSVADLSGDEVLDFFDNQVNQRVVNANGDVLEDIDFEAIDIDLAKEKKKAPEERVYPVYEVNLDGNNFYIFSVRGIGLWDAIWGNVALESDLNTIAGVSFDHAAETPGLGAEIKDNRKWVAQFVGTKIYTEDGKYVSILVRKGGAIDRTHEVDGLSGATVTADGVTDMLYDGLQAYEPYMEEAGSASK